MLSRSAEGIRFIKSSKKLATAVNPKTFLQGLNLTRSSTLSPHQLRSKGRVKLKLFHSSNWSCFLNSNSGPDQHSTSSFSLSSLFPSLSSGPSTQPITLPQLNRHKALSPNQLLIIKQIGDQDLRLINLILDFLESYRHLKSKLSNISPLQRLKFIDHHTLSVLLKSSAQYDPLLSREIYDDLNSFWGLHPTEQDQLNNLSAILLQSPNDLTRLETTPNISDLFFQHSQNYGSTKKLLSIFQSSSNYRNSASSPSQIQLAHLIRLAIREDLPEEQLGLIKQAQDLGFGSELLIHGAQIRLRAESLDYIMSQLNSGVKLDDWIETDLLQQLTVELPKNQISIETILDTLSKLYSHSIQRPRSMILLESVLKFLITSCGLKDLNYLADRLLEITNIDIFRDLPYRSFSKFFDPLLITLDVSQTLELHQMVKSRRNEVWLSVLIKLTNDLEDESIGKAPEHLHDLFSDLQNSSSNPPLETSIIDRVFWLDQLNACSIGLISSAIKLNQVEMVQAILSQLSKRQSNHSLRDGLLLCRPVDCQTIKDLLHSIFSLPLSREEVFTSFNNLLKLGRVDYGFFDDFLNKYLLMHEAPTNSNDERPQALSMSRLMTIIDQMNSSSCPPDHRTYSSLLNHFSRTVHRNPRNISTKLQLERIHTLIKLDVRLEPDSELLHELLKAYSYNGLYPQAWKVWDVLSNEKRFRENMKNKSLATIIDLAGYESEKFGDGRLNPKVVVAWEELIKSSSSSSRGVSRWRRCKINKNLWDSWIECLCRSKRIEYAIDNVFSNMNGRRADQQGKVETKGSESKNLEDGEVEEVNIRADQRTLSIILRFLKKDIEEEDDERYKAELKELDRNLRKRLKDEFSEIWEDVKNEGLTPNEILRSTKST